MAGLTLDQMPMTDRQVEVYDWICRYIAANGFSPTIRELCEAFGFKSKNGALCHLHPLRRRGMVDWVDGKARTLRTTEVQS